MTTSAKKWDSINYEDEPAEWTDRSARDWTIPLGYVRVHIGPPAPPLPCAHDCFSLLSIFPVLPSQGIKISMSGTPRDVDDALRLAATVAAAF